MLLSMEEYQDMADSYQGYCTLCEAFTRDCTEPDAEEYDCPDCGENSVMGAEQAILLGEIEITG